MMWNEFNNPRWACIALEEFVWDEMVLGNRVAHYLDSEKFEHWSALDDRCYLQHEYMPTAWCFAKI